MKKEKRELFALVIATLVVYALLFIVSYWTGFAKERGTAQIVYATLLLTHCFCFDAAIYVNSETRSQAAVFVCANSIPCAAYILCLLL